ncbi:MAG: dihydropteroate synthase [Candidatus Omnitrophota bacterium]
MREIGVDPYGIDIMLPKAAWHLVRTGPISSIAANILKQEMLSLGGDVAVSRETLTGKVKKTDCLAMANLSQYRRLCEKLEKQPFGLDNAARELAATIANYQKDEFRLRLGRYALSMKRGRAYVMGIINLTPDSFSGDGLYKGRVSYSSASCGIVEAAQRMADDGADIIDIGGESSRPGARPVTLREELKRTIPAIKRIAKKVNVPVSIDTYKPEVARQALDSGAVMVNDISGLSTAMAKVVSGYKAGVVIMHMKGRPRHMQRNPVYGSLIDEIIQYLSAAIKRGEASGVDRKKIIIDPGIGFGKRFEHNLEILRGLKEFKVLGRPIMVGPSRKSFLGEILNAAAQERVFGTVSACVLAVKNGANIVRVHDVRAVKDAVKVLNSVNSITR